MNPLAVRTDGKGPDLILVHGWGMHGGVFDEIVPLLDQTMTVHRVDLPGHGASAGVDWIADLDRLADQLANQLPGGAWLGWSLGGMVALALAARHPDRVSRLVLSATTPRWTAGPDWPHGMPETTFREFRHDLGHHHEATWQRFLSLEVHGSDTAGRDLRQLRTIAGRYPPPSDTVLDSGLELLSSTDLRPRLASIRAPALVIGGPRDRLVRPAAMQWLAGALPNARQVMIPGAGHAPFLGHPGQFCAAVNQFMQEASHV